MRRKRSPDTPDPPVRQHDEKRSWTAARRVEILPHAIRSHRHHPRLHDRSLHHAAHGAGPLVSRDALAPHRADARRPRPRAGRRASQPNVFYIGFDNGGVWRSTDYGSNWVPLFDGQPTGSIGAIAVAPSDPNIIYVGTGAGIIRPDLATGDGVYKSTDAGKTWTHLGLRDSADDRDDRRRSRAIPNRLFVAALGHPVRPERRARHLPLDRRRRRRSRRCSTRTSTRAATTCASIRATRTSSTRRSGSSSRASSRARDSAAPANGIFKSTDGGTTWKQLTDGLPTIIQANIAIAPSNPKMLYAMVARRRTAAAAGTAASIGFYKSTDGGEHWIQRDRAVRAPPARTCAGHASARRASAAATCRRVTVDPKDENVVYSCVDGVVAHRGRRR